MLSRAQHWNADAAFSKPCLACTVRCWPQHHATPTPLRGCAHQFRHAAPELPGSATGARARSVPDQVVISGESQSAEDTPQALSPA